MRLRWPDGDMGRDLSLEIGVLVESVVDEVVCLAWRDQQRLHPNRSVLAKLLIIRPLCDDLIRRYGVKAALLILVRCTFERFALLALVFIISDAGAAQDFLPCLTVSVMLVDRS